MDMAQPPEIVPLDKSHDVSAFDCGVVPLNDYLHKYALQNTLNRSARTYLAIRNAQVIGYYSLAAGSVNKADAPTRIVKGLANHPVPIILIARLAVAKSEHGTGIGKGLLKDALLRSVRAADLIGCRAVLVHAKDESATRFYRRFGFESSRIDERHLFLLLKDILASQQPESSNES